jgi:2',3'-cyclic-nucleotide 2'-phosphodiesterase (5'-nucleotidase family)
MVNIKIFSLCVDLDAQELSGVDIMVAGGEDPDAVIPDPRVESYVIAPVANYVDDLAINVIADSEVDLNGLRSDVRSVETNEGNLIADAIRWQAAQLAGSFGVPIPDVADTVTTDGTRIEDLVLDDGTVVVDKVRPLPLRHIGIIATSGSTKRRLL